MVRRGPHSGLQGTTGPELSFKSQAVLEPAAELWRRTLAQVPTIFGQLVYLASLRDVATNRYVHQDLTPLLGSEGADRMLCHSHHQVFSKWITSSLEEQKSDLDEYVRNAGGRRIFSQQYRDLIPPMARDV